MSFTGDFINAQTACDWGLVVEVVPHEVLMERARQVASSITSLPSENVHEIRRVYEVVTTLMGKDAWAAEAEASRASGWKCDSIRRDSTNSAAPDPVADPSGLF
jgi:enoyl-CoA hydratase/carnithine racemase